VQLGHRDEAGSLARFPGPALEDLLRDRLGRLGVVRGGGDLRAAISRIEVGRRKVVVEFAGSVDAIDPTRLGPDEAFEIRDGFPALTIPAVLKWRGGAKVAIGPGGTPAVDALRVDLPLLKALIRAEGWKRRILAGEATLDALGAVEGLNRSYAQRVARIAFLSADLKRAILDGRQPPKLSLRRLLQEDIPPVWLDQASAWA
jgi:site-specific DNA recombinase